MASLTLNVVSATLTSEFGSGHGLDQHGKWVLAATVEFPYGERLELGTGEKPINIDMSLTFRETEAGLVEWATKETKDIEDNVRKNERMVCGTLSYHKARDSDFNGRPALLMFYILTPSNVMASLIRFAEQGRFLKRVTVEVLGMQYGYAPDGSEKRWLTNAENKTLPITAVDYELPLLEQPDDKPEFGEPTTPVGVDLVPVLRETLKWLKAGVWLLVIIAGVIVFKS